MNREALLSKLSIRLSHLAEAANTELNKELESLRHSLREGIDEPELHKISERLARHLLLDDSTAAATTAPPALFAAEFARQIRTLPLDKSYRAQLTTLADQLLAAGQLEQQLQTLNEVFQLLQTATTSAPVKKASSSGLLGWLDKKSGAASAQVDLFLEKSTRLIDQAIQHIEVLDGNSNETRALKAQLEQPSSVESLGEALEQVINLLQEHSIRIEAERATTQNFLADLRTRLSSVEDAVLSVISDGDQSLERAVLLEQEVGDNVREIGDSVRDDDLDVLKQTVETGLTKLSSKLADYLQAEKHSHKESKEKVEGLNRKLREMEAEARSLRGQIQDKQDLAVKDALTGVYNRAGYEQRFNEEWARSSRSKSPLSLVFVDCNNFKQINDTYGHAAGDIVLVQIAQALVSRTRASDIVARFGGDEFIVVLPDTPADGAEFFAREACQQVLGAGFNANGQPLDVSISCGVAQANYDDTPETLLQRADAAMYQAKKVSPPQVMVA